MGPLHLNLDNIETSFEPKEGLAVLPCYKDRKVCLNSLLKQIDYAECDDALIEQISQLTRYFTEEEIRKVIAKTSNLLRNPESDLVTKQKFVSSFRDVRGSIFHDLKEKCSYTIMIFPRERSLEELLKIKDINLTENLNFLTKKGIEAFEKTLSLLSDTDYNVDSRIEDRIVSFFIESCNEKIVGKWLESLAKMTRSIVIKIYKHKILNPEFRENILDALYEIGKKRSDLAIIIHIKGIDKINEIMDDSLDLKEEFEKLMDCDFGSGYQSSQKALIIVASGEGFELFEKFSLNEERCFRIQFNY